MTKSLNCDTIFSTTNSSSSCSDLSPKDGGSMIKKPIRRRSRASKKTPTTHLNANISNFRALVQQFTGCHTSNTFLGAHKGPINLNFGVDEDEGLDLDTDHTTTVSSLFAYDHCYDFRFQSQQQKEIKKEAIKDQEEVRDREEQKGMLSVDHHSISYGSSSTMSSSSPTMDIFTLDDFELENLCLHDLSGEFTSTDNIWDDDNFIYGY